MLKTNLADAVNITDSRDNEALNSLVSELEKGISNMKNGKLYTLEEAWKEIDEV